MSVWVSESELASRLGYKILIAGLSEAGKTAVKRIFFMKQQTQDVDSLGATINYERMAVSIAGVPITIVDLGGQRIFIKRFLSNFSPFIFSAVQVFIFLIDVAAKTTRNNSIQYFTSCVEKLKTHSPDAQIFVFLHKNDLVRHLPNYESIHTQLKERFQQESSSKIYFLRTTIYKPESVVDAFGRIFEIATPQIANSEYVEGRTIGAVEEFAEKFYTVAMQDEICPNCFNALVDSPDGLICSFCGKHERKIEVTATTDSSTTALENLQNIMKETLGRGSVQPVKEETLSVATTISEQEDKSSAVLEKLQSLMMESMSGRTKQELTEDSIDSVEEHVVTPALPEISESSGVKQESIPSIEPLEMAGSVFDEELEEDLAPVSSVKSVFDEDTIIDDMKSIEKTATLEIPHLTKFYGITEKEATDLVDGGHIDTFEAAAKAGVPVKILLSVFFKFIPYMKDKGLSEGVDFDTRMMEVFFAHLNGLVREDEIFETMIFVANKQDMPVEQIVKKYLVKLRQEKEKKKKLEEKPEKVTVPEETVALPENVIPFPLIHNIGFLAEKEDSNCRISFYHGAYCVNITVVSTRMLINELKYMIIFESELPLKGRETEFAEIAAPLIREEIYRIFKPKKIEIQKTVTIEKIEKVRKSGIKTAPPTSNVKTALPKVNLTLESADETEEEIPVEELLQSASDAVSGRSDRRLLQTASDAVSGRSDRKLTKPERKVFTKPLDVPGEQAQPDIKSPLIPLLRGIQFFFRAEVVGNNIFQIFFILKEQVINQLAVPITVTREELHEFLSTMSRLPSITSEKNMSLVTQLVYSTLQSLKNTLESHKTREKSFPRPKSRATSRRFDDDRSSELLQSYLELLSEDDK